MAVKAEVSPDIIVQRLLAAGNPERIILFGSRARDAAHARSDYDLLIVQGSGAPRAARAGAYYKASSDLPIEVDLMAVTPEEIRDWE